MTIERTIQVTVTPSEAASVFASWNDEQQAEFFDEITKYVSICGPSGFNLSVQSAHIAEHLTAPARIFIAGLSSFATEERCS